MKRYTIYTDEWYPMLKVMKDPTSDIYPTYQLSDEFVEEYFQVLHQFESIQEKLHQLIGQQPPRYLYDNNPYLNLDGDI